MSVSTENKDNNYLKTQIRWHRSVQDQHHNHVHNNIKVNINLAITTVRDYKIGELQCDVDLGGNHVSIRAFE